MTAAELIPNVLPKTNTLTAAEVDAIIEIAYLTIAADRRLEGDEIAAFRGVLERLRGKALAPTDLDHVLDDMYARAEKARTGDGEGYADERLRELAAKLSTTAREIAYKCAYAIGFADMESSDEEFELDLQLVDALELTNERAEELASEVVDVLNPPE